SVNPNTAVGILDGDKNNAPINLPAPGGFGNKGQGGAVDELRLRDRIPADNGKRKDLEAKYFDDTTSMREQRKTDKERTFFDVNKQQEKAQETLGDAKDKLPDVAKLLEETNKAD